MNKYKNLIYAGTFDHLHIGHKKMIDLAFKLADSVSLGITDENMSKQKFLGQFGENLELRMKHLSNYLKKKKYNKRAKIFVLHNILGPSVLSHDFDAILVTKATLANARKVNVLRRKRGFKELKIIVKNFIKGTDGKTINSVRIRNGEINREGNSVLSSLTLLKGKKRKFLQLPKNMRNDLRKPLGKIFKGEENTLVRTTKKTLSYIKKKKYAMVIAIGDIIVSSLIKEGFDADIKIVDLMSRRQKLEENSIPYFSFAGSPDILSRLNPSNSAWIKHKVSKIFGTSSTISNVINNSGTINLKSFSVLRSAINKYLGTQKKQLILVRGEEDLLTLSSILLAPLSSLVLYGQWNLGVVAVEVTEKKKKEVLILLNKFN